MSYPDFTEANQLRGEVATLRAQLTSLDTRLMESCARNKPLHEEIRSLRAQLAEATDAAGVFRAERDRLLDERDVTMTKLAEVTAERDALAVQIEGLTAERDYYRVGNVRLMAERDALDLALGGSEDVVDSLIGSENALRARMERVMAALEPTVENLAAIEDAILSDDDPNESGAFLAPGNVLAAIRKRAGLGVKP